MAIKLTGGQARGRALTVPIQAGVRPTSSRVREALFSMIGQDLSGKTVLDGFGGAGVVGLEAWSRGARVTVVERDRAACRAVGEQGRILGADWTVRREDVFELALSGASFDVVFLDPPYAFDPVHTVSRLAPLASEVLIYESERGAGALPKEVGSLSLHVHKTYGRTALWVYR